MKSLLAAVVPFLLAVPSLAQADTNAQQLEREAEFQKLMSGCRMVGSFTMGGAGGAKGPARKESYTISKVEKVKGMNITIVTSASTDEEAKALLRCFGLPFRN